MRSLSGLPAGGYFRRSKKRRSAHGTPGDDDGLSIETQQRAYHEWAERAGVVSVDTYVDDGRSGFRDSASRPDFGRLCRDVRAGRIRVVWVLISSRFSRDDSLSDDVLDEWDRLGVLLVVNNQVVDRSTPWGWLAAKASGFTDELYSRQVSFFTRLNLRTRAEGGDWIGSVPFGYTRGPDGVLVPNDDAPVVARIFARYGEGQLGDLQLASAMNVDGYRMRDNRTGRRYPFGRESIRGILTNAAYLGLVSCGGVTYAGRHAPLVERDVWERVQALRAARARSGGGGQVTREHGLLGGVGCCARCGGRLWYHRSASPRGARQYVYYRCGGVSRRTCDAPMVRADVIDAALRELLRALTLPPDLQAEVRQAAEALLQHEDRPADDAARTRAQLDRIKLLFELGDMDEREYLAKRRALQTALQGAAPQQPAVDLERVFARLTSLAALVDAATESELRRITADVFAAVWCESHAIKAITPTGLYLPLVGVMCDWGGRRAFAPTATQTTVALPPLWRRHNEPLAAP